MIWGCGVGAQLMWLGYLRSADMFGNLGDVVGRKVKEWNLVGMR